MVKALSSSRNTSQQEDNQKKRKKQAKKEARLMLQVDQVKKDIRKAEQKVGKFQAELQEHQTRLHQLEEELTLLHRAGQGTAEGHGHDTTPEQPTASAASAAIDQSPTNEEPQPSPSQPAEGRSDIDLEDAASSQVSLASVAANPVDQPSSSLPAEGRGDVAQEHMANTPTSTPIENIPSESPADTAGAQVHTDIVINPPAEEDLTINSGAGSMPIVTHDEHAWPPPQIREEVAEAIEQEATQQHNNPHEGEQHQAEGTAEKDLTINSGEGSMPIVTHDEHAWPPPQIREEVAEAVEEEIVEQHATDNSQNKSTARGNSHRTSRISRRRSNSSAQQGTDTAGQEE